jgi:hypothetical protein
MYVYMFILTYMYSMYMYVYMYSIWYVDICIHGKQQFPFVCCKEKLKREVCFSRTANDKRSSRFAVSANMPIYECQYLQYSCKKGVACIWQLRYPRPRPSCHVAFHGSSKMGALSFLFFFCYCTFWSWEIKFLRVVGGVRGVVPGAGRTGVPAKQG